MYISSINQANLYNRNFVSSKKQNVKSENEQKNITQLSFQASSLVNLGAVGLRKVKMENPQTKEVCTRFMSILRNLPKEMKMSGPSFYEVNGDKIGYYVDKKSLPKRIQLIVKTNVENIKDWDDKDNLGTILDCIFNDKGLLQVGKLSQKQGSDKVTEIEFLHTGKEGRRLSFNDILYRPVAGKKDVWAVVPNPTYRYSMGEYDLLENLKNVQFSDLFLEMANNKASVLLK